MFGIGIMGMTSVYPDMYNVLKIVPTNDTIQNDKNFTYCFKL